MTYSKSLRVLDSPSTLPTNLVDTAGARLPRITLRQVDGCFGCHSCSIARLVFDLDGLTYETATWCVATAVMFKAFTLLWIIEAKRAMVQLVLAALCTAASELVFPVLRRCEMRSQAPSKGVLTTHATSTLGISAYGNQGTSLIP